MVVTYKKEILLFILLTCFNLVLQKEPRLRFYPYYFLILAPAFLISFNYSLFGTWLQTFALCIINFWFIIHIYYLYIISTVPEAASKYNVIRSIRKNGIRSFSTAKATAHVCKACVKFVIFGGVTLYSLEKIAYGIQYRGPLTNAIASHFNGNIKSNNDFILAAAQTILDCDSSVRSQIVDENGWVKSSEISKLAAKYGIDLLKKKAIYSEPPSLGKRILAWFNTPRKN